MALLLAAGLGWMRFSTPPAPPGNLAGASLGGPFTLTNQDGQTVRDTDFAGRWRLIYFGYGFCPDVCPTDLALVGRGLQAFEAQEAGRAANVAPIFITIDPERDTPAVLKPFVAAFHPRLVGRHGLSVRPGRQAGRFLAASGAHGRRRHRIAGHPCPISRSGKPPRFTT
jgi:protein SCO1/2